jgi:hypothetical protein
MKKQKKIAKKRKILLRDVKKENRRFSKKYVPQKTQTMKCIQNFALILGGFYYPVCVYFDERICYYSIRAIVPLGG